MPSITYLYFAFGSVIVGAVKWIGKKLEIGKEDELSLRDFYKPQDEVYSIFAEVMK